MPGMNGFDVVEKTECCKIVRLSSLPLIVPFRMPSGHFAWESAISLKKPIDTDTLKEAIQRAIGWEFTGNESFKIKALFYIHTHYWEKNRIGNTGGGSLLYPQSSVSFV